MYQRKQAIRETVSITKNKVGQSSVDGKSVGNRVEKLNCGDVGVVSDEIDDNEWVLFGDYEEIKTSNNGKVDSNSVLSTRMSTYKTVSNDVLSSDIEDDDSEEIYDEDYDVDDEDSFICDVRESYNSIRDFNMRQLEREVQNDLVCKVNNWKNELRSVETPSDKVTVKTKKHKCLKNKISHTFIERRKVYNTVNKLYGSLKRDSHPLNVEHEGIFMNNPELEKCIPGYWKRMMLDNLMFSNEHNCMLNMTVMNDDIIASGRHFWEVDESASVSTGWEGGNNILGF